MRGAVGRVVERQQHQLRNQARRSNGLVQRPAAPEQQLCHHLGGTGAMDTNSCLEVVEVRVLEACQDKSMCAFAVVVKHGAPDVMRCLPHMHMPHNQHSNRPNLGLPAVMRVQDRRRHNQQHALQLVQGRERAARVGAEVAHGGGRQHGQRAVGHLVPHPQQDILEGAPQQGAVHGALVKRVGHLCRCVADMWVLVGGAVCMHRASHEQCCVGASHDLRAWHASMPS